MKCQNCGAELADGVLFCRECGSKVTNIPKRFCRECGAELSDGAAFCAKCGTRIEMLEFQTDDTQDGSRKPEPMNNEADDLNPRKHKKTKPAVIVLVIILVLALLGAFMYFFGADYFGISLPGRDSQEEVIIDTDVPTNYTIEKGTKYAYMSDEWNVYIAVAVSDTIIKIENWDKSSSDDKSVKLSADIGTYMINDRANGFSWLDDSHTAFNIVFADKNNSRVKKARTHTFTINTSDDDKFKGTNFNEKIACYTYTNDDWHKYRAIPLTDNLIKIECWHKSNEFLIFGEFFNYGWDWCVIDTNSTEMDFKWTDDEHTSFTITAQDPANKYYWKKQTLVVFELENPNYQYPSVKAYLEK